MGDEVNPPRRGRVRRLLVPVVAFLAGFVLGVFADRLYQDITTRPPDARLTGEWVAEDEWYARFHPDGTYDSVKVTRASGKVVQQEPYSSQYRWVGRDVIELYDPLVSAWVTRRLVFEGDQLTLLGDSGEVRRLTRKKG